MPETFSIIGYVGLLLNPMKVALYGMQNAAASYAAILRVNKVLLADEDNHSIMDKAL